ncbi:MAG: 4Fe-4S dicluster domain-containing protein [Firmicutes bacterium]|nr:4Fe-4S dicluster domain-containing protein [Bacillota bacterium]
MTTRKMVFVDTSLCTGCKACSVACKAWNELPAEKTQLVTSYQAQKDFTPNTWTYVKFNEVTANDGKMNWHMVKLQCFHCAEPACLKACSSNAISKTESGYTLIDKEKCIGCGYCVANCPWNIPRTNAETNKTSKCTGCIDRVENGLLPACVHTCQPGALQFGERDKMVETAKARLAEVKTAFPNAMLYGDALMGGTTYLYLLTDNAQTYGLPPNPSMPFSLTLWKDIVHPLGGIAVAASAAAIAAGVVANFARGNYRNRGKNTHDDSHQEGGK